ncbi:hypothetical protein NEOLEDRAFT_1136790 [Neolentinus lepideus HHB14362 ss-1]|uniref:PLP-dependent transferase n=1 Tax=Neolentinus lepideus HHB14362 ss-1 TaxID=1314782 RepID=A0A165R1C9_9AGAM|nr:hypothetical protein NEOLEDRAFT_1136790 [Neolentinus lepideus HHB14362 ss-1]
MGELFKSHLFERAYTYGIKQHILSIRGRGLMLGVQLVLPDSIIEDGTLAQKVQAIMFDKHKVIIERGGRHGSVLRVLPPLTISSEEVHDAADLLARSIAEAVGAN